MLYPRITSKWIQCIRLKTIKTLEENIGSEILDIIRSNIFSDAFPSAKEIKEKINEWDYIKLKSFFTAKETIKNLTQDQLYGRTYLLMILLIRV